jgi:hypothetical protein
LYNYTYSDKTKSGPFVGVTAVEAEEPGAMEEIAIDGSSGTNRTEHNPGAEGYEHRGDGRGGAPHHDAHATTDVEGGGDVEQRRWTTGEVTTTAAIGAGATSERPPSVSSTTSSKSRKMGLLQRVMRAKGEKKRGKRGSSDDSGSFDARGLESGPRKESYMDERQSAMSLPVGVGAGTSTGAGTGTGSQPASGE